jgi:chromate transport protein ChrA
MTEVTPEEVVSILFWSSFVLDLLIMWYAMGLSKRMGHSGFLYKTTIYAASSALIFGLQHFLEAIIADLPSGMVIAETVEGVAIILLGIAVYQLFKLTASDN